MKIERVLPLILFLSVISFAPPLSFTIPMRMSSPSLVHTIPRTGTPVICPSAAFLSTSKVLPLTIHAKLPSSS
eukprot:12379592-Ditylum_brightwellii.AAC.1